MAKAFLVFLPSHNAATPDKFPICAGARSAELVHNAGILGVQLINADEVFGTHRGS